MIVEDKLTNTKVEHELIWCLNIYF